MINSELSTIHVKLILRVNILDTTNFKLTPLDKELFAFPCIVKLQYTVIFFQDSKTMIKLLNEEREKIFIFFVLAKKCG